MVRYSITQYITWLPHLQLPPCLWFSPPAPVYRFVYHYDEFHYWMHCLTLFNSLTQLPHLGVLVLTQRLNTNSLPHVYYAWKINKPHLPKRICLGVMWPTVKTRNELRNGLIPWTDQKWKYALISCQNDHFTHCPSTWTLPATTTQS